MIYDDVVKVIEENSGVNVDFGTSQCELIPSQDRLLETEKILGIVLPPSFRWFLTNYGGGTIFGDELFTISKSYCDHDMFDIASRTLNERAHDFINNDEIILLSTDFGEQFLMATSQQSENGEFAIIRKFGKERQRIADSFAEFMMKYIQGKID